MEANHIPLRSGPQRRIDNAHSEICAAELEIEHASGEEAISKAYHRLALAQIELGDAVQARRDLVQDGDLS